METTRTCVVLVWWRPYSRVSDPMTTLVSEVTDSNVDVSLVRWLRWIFVSVRRHELVVGPLPKSFCTSLLFIFWFVFRKFTFFFLHYFLCQMLKLLSVYSSSSSFLKIRTTVKKILLGQSAPYFLIFPRFFWILRILRGTSFVFKNKIT